MKKETLKDEIGRLTAETYRLEQELADHCVANLKLTEEIEQMRAHWRPVPITHEWQPRNPQCALCDDPKDSPRHRAGGGVRVSWVPQVPTPPGLPAVLHEISEP